MTHKIRKLKEDERLPAAFWEDHKWALEQYSELKKKYADMWVAIVDKKVVAYGEDLTDEKEKSIQDKIGRLFVTLFVEGDLRVLCS